MEKNKKNLIFTKTPLDGLFVIERNIVNDQRGTFFRAFCERELQEAGFTDGVSQINYSLTNKKFTTRGFHFQCPPFCESKIITCISGEVYDVALDLRKGSPTFLKCFGVILSEKNYKSHYLPQGFAHAFQSLAEESSLLYVHSKSYNPEYESGVNVSDPRIDVIWPNKPQNMSTKDLNLPMLGAKFEGI